MRQLQMPHDFIVLYRVSLKHYNFGDIVEKQTFSTVGEFKEWLKMLAVSIRTEKAENGYTRKGNLFSKKFRHYHLAYCMLRGTEYKKIEEKVSEFNEPNMIFVNDTIKRHKEVWNAANVRFATEEFEIAK